MLRCAGLVPKCTGLCYNDSIIRSRSFVRYQPQNRVRIRVDCYRRAKIMLGLYASNVIIRAEPVTHCAFSIQLTWEITLQQTEHVVATYW